MLTSAAYFHDPGFFGILAILAAVLAIFLCATVTCRMGALVFLLVCHIRTLPSLNFGPYAKTGDVAGQVATANQGQQQQAGAENYWSYII